MNEDIAKQDENIAKLTKEKKGVEDSLQEYTEKLQACEDKFNAINKAKGKQEGTLKEVNRFASKQSLLVHGNS